MRSTSRGRSGLPTRHKAFRRRGAMLVVALACLLIVMSIIGSMIQGALRSRRHLHAERDRRQVELLVEAGADRAALQLARDLEFRSETWDLSADDLLGRGEAQVAVTVSREADDAPWQVQVVAEYPLGSELSIRRSKTFVIQPSTTEVQE